MDRAALKDAFYGGLEELIKDPRYFYFMGYSSNYTYSHFTDLGQKAVQDYIAMMAPQIAQAHKKHLDDQAKTLVMKELTQTSKE